MAQIMSNIFSFDEQNEKANTKDLKALLANINKNPNTKTTNITKDINIFNTTSQTQSPRWI